MCWCWFETTIVKWKLKLVSKMWNLSSKYQKDPPAIEKSTGEKKNAMLSKGKKCDWLKFYQVDSMLFAKTQSHSRHSSHIHGVQQGATPPPTWKAVVYHATSCKEMEGGLVYSKLFCECCKSFFFKYLLISMNPKRLSWYSRSIDRCRYYKKVIKYI